MADETEANAASKRRRGNPAGWRLPVFFLHVPKTAGTAVRHFLESSLLPQEMHRITDVEREMIERATSPLSPQIKFASGHLPYWYRNAFPTIPATLLFLRHPIERALSTYRFWRSLPYPGDRDRTPGADLLRAVRKVSLEEFATNREGIWWGAISNYASWLLGHATPWNLDAPADSLTPRLARKRLPTIEMIGVTERVTESMSLIAEYLGLPLSRNLPSLNASPLDKESRAVPKSVATALADANAHDMALWEDANAELDRRLACAAKGAKTRVLISTLAASRFLPVCTRGGHTLKLGETPIIGEGWLPPERGGELTWRFSASPGPSDLYVQWPVGHHAYALAIESPFAARYFDYESLKILIDGEQLASTSIRLASHTLIITEALAGNSPARQITFQFADPNSTLAERRSHGAQTAFAISSIRWIPCSKGAWPITSEIAAVANVLGSLASERAQAIATLEAMIAEKDEYVASLLEALTKKDAHAAALSDELCNQRRSRAA